MGHGTDPGIQGAGADDCPRELAIARGGLAGPLPSPPSSIRSEKSKPQNAGDLLRLFLIPREVLPYDLTGVDVTAGQVFEDAEVRVRYFRTNHLNNCLLCHPPAATAVEPVLGLDPVVSIPVSPGLAAVVNRLQTTPGSHGYGNQSSGPTSILGGI